MDMTGMLLVLFNIALINIVAWLTPGPNMFAVMNASLTGGRPIGLATGFGVAAASFLWAALAVLGVRVVFEAYPQGFQLLRGAGAGYMLWLGFRALRAAFAGTAGGAGAANPLVAGSRLVAFRSGFAICAANPKATLFFASILTAFVPPDASGRLLIAILLLCGVLGVACHSITATLFSTPALVRWFERNRNRAYAVFGGVFCFFALAIIHDLVTG
jgi:threonine/homoserine/homoserine lactone efflux protein